MGACSSCTKSTAASLSSGFGASAATNVSDAVKQAIAAASVPNPTIAFISCTSDRDCEAVRAEFAKALPKVAIHGITTAGMGLLQTSGPLAKAVGCLLIDAEPGSFAAAFDENHAVKAAAALKLAMPSPKAVILGTTPGKEEDALKAVRDAFGDVPVYGGTAADNELKGQWKVMGTTGSSGEGVSLVGIGAKVRFGASMIGPYTPTAKTAKVTKASGRRVSESNGKPASEWVYDWLRDDVKEAYENGGLILPQTAQKPIGIKKPSGEWVSLHLAGLGDKKEKHVDFFGPVPEGSELVVMDSGDGPKTGYASTMGDAYDAAMSSGGLSRPRAGILIFCGGMAIAVGDNLGKGLEGLKKKADGLPLLGMGCFGEQALLPGAKECVQRNLSLGVLLFE
jgi:hypothetical protein